MLEELGLAYQIESFDITSGHQRSEAFRALNPLGKVPTLVDNGTPVSELGAIAIYLGDAHSGMAPPVGDPDRAAYLRWVFFASAVVEPCLAERFFKWDIPSGNVAWGSYERMMPVLLGGLEPGPWLLAEQFTMADVVVASVARFGTMFGAMDKEKSLMAYLERCQARPAFVAASKIEASLAPQASS